MTLRQAEEAPRDRGRRRRHHGAVRYVGWRGAGSTTPPTRYGVGGRSRAHGPASRPLGARLLGARPSRRLEMRPQPHQPTSDRALGPPAARTRVLRQAIPTRAARRRGARRRAASCARPPFLARTSRTSSTGRDACARRARRAPARRSSTRDLAPRLAQRFLHDARQRGQPPAGQAHASRAPALPSTCGSTLAATIICAPNRPEPRRPWPRDGCHCLQRQRSRTRGRDPPPTITTHHHPPNLDGPDQLARLLSQPPSDAHAGGRLSHRHRFAYSPPYTAVADGGSLVLVPRAARGGRSCHSRPSTACWSCSRSAWATAT